MSQHALSYPVRSSRVRADNNPTPKPNCRKRERASQMSAYHPIGAGHRPVTQPAVPMMPFAPPAPTLRQLPQIAQPAVNTSPPPSASPPNLDSTLQGQAFVATVRAQEASSYNLSSPTPQNNPNVNLPHHPYHHPNPNPQPRSHSINRPRPNLNPNPVHSNKRARKETFSSYENKVVPHSSSTSQSLVSTEEKEIDTGVVDWGENGGEDQRVVELNDEDEEEKEETFYNMLNLAVFQFLRPEDVLLVRQVSWKWRKRLNNTPLLLCSVWEALPYDIFWSMRKNELRNPIQAGSVGSLSPDLNPGMLHKLFKWILDLALDYRMTLQTVFSSCSIVYRVLSKMSVARKHLQLVGMIGFLLGAKVHERQPPLVPECHEVCAKLYSTEEIQRTEIVVAKNLQWSLNSPNVYTVLMHILQSPRFNVHEECHCLAVFLTELTLTDWQMAGLVPTKVAISIACLAQYAYKRPYFQTVIMSGYNRSHLVDAARRMDHLWKRYCPESEEDTELSRTLKERYAGPETGNVSKMRPPEKFIEDFQNGGP
ncbi:hypothetical protein AAMO2058_000677100 [Amorphochlora amoebiformis]